MRSREYEIALSTFERVRGAFPALTMTLNPDPEHVDLSMDIPAQPGLRFAVDLNLQNVDELHLSAAGFTVGWFPCTDPARVDAYFDAVSGLLSGRFRILEHKPAVASSGRSCSAPARAAGSRLLRRRCCGFLGRGRASMSFRTSPPPDLELERALALHWLGPRCTFLPGRRVGPQGAGADGHDRALAAFHLGARRRRWASSSNCKGEDPCGFPYS